LKYRTKHIAIIIPTVGGKNLYKVLHSIKHQSQKVGQIIVVQYQLKKKLESKNLVFVSSSIKNQVYQRCLAKKYIKKNIKIILQLDDNCYLKKNALEELTKCWNNSSKNVAGIGLNIENYQPKKINFIVKLLDKKNMKPGQVLKSGYVTAWGKNFFTHYPQWLNGGSSSWKLANNKDIFSRRFPKLSWSICEDLIYSYNKFQKYKLKLSRKSKAKYLNKNVSFSFQENFNKGLILSKVLKNFVIYNKNLSLFEFFKYTLVTSIFGLIFNIIFLNYSYTGYFIGRIVACFMKTYKYKIK
tara:strand:- start:606 stop:1499 length:894 start_codon:yes stop_codon:yes gene_type:complete